MTAAQSRRRSTWGGHRLLVLAAIAVLSIAACGSDESTPLVADEPDDPSTTTTDSPSDDDSETLPPPDDPTGDPGDATPVIVDDEGYEPTLAMADITDPKQHPIDDVVVSEDGDRLGVRYEAASEPCSGALAHVAETADTVTVTLETGLNPGAAAMTCIAEVLRYELAVTLEEPLGDRTLIFEDATTTTTVRPPTTNDAEDTADGFSSPGAFVGLALADAQAKANGEGRPWRIGRQDDEIYALTADYNPERVTFDVDGGVVTNAVAG